MKEKTVVLALTSLLLIGCLFGTALGAGKESAISQIQLTQEALPAGMKIIKEVWASIPQLLNARKRIGFPVNALLNQTILYDDGRMKVNYMVTPNEEWLDFGYSKLIAMDGGKSLVLMKSGVIVQIAASTRDLEDKAVDLLKANIVHRRKIRIHRLPKDWILVSEKRLQIQDLQKLEERIGARVQNAVAQEFLADREKIKVSYYECDSPRIAEDAARYLTNAQKPMTRQLVRSYGPLAVKAESQNAELNTYALALMNW